VRKIDKSEVFINLSVADFQINADQGYGYKGKVFRNEVPGLVQALSGSTASYPTIVFKVYYGGNLVRTVTSSVSAKNNLNGFSGDGFALPATEEQMKDPSWLVEAVELKSFNTSPEQYTFTNLIEKHLDLVESKNNYKKQINIAERALGNASTIAQYLIAKSEFGTASRISPDESYPKTQMEQIDGKIEALRKSERDREAAEKSKAELDEKQGEEKAKADKAIKKKKPEVAKKKELTEEEIDQLNKRNQEASKLEVDGDELVYSDPVAAKQKYEQAQLINYTTRVAQKIVNLKTNLQVNSAFQVIKGVDKLAESLDPEGNTDFYCSFSGFDGLAANNEKLNKAYPSEPWNVSLYGIKISKLFLALELRLGYFNSPYYEFEVRNNKDINRNIDKIAIQQQALSTGVSGGLNFRIRKNVVVYGLYGVEWLGLPISKQVLPKSRYSFDEDDYPPKFPNLVFVLSTGIDCRIPKTNVGIGVRYNMNKVQIKPKDANVKINGGEDSRYQYFMNKISSDKIDFNNIGVRFFWNWN
jgi:hypothetical protein